MKVDLGFWNNKGEYIEDIQELNEIERKEIMENKMQKSFEIVEELKSMAENFLDYNEEMNKKQDEQCKECICESCKTVASVVIENKKLRDENAELKAENERLNRCMMEELHHEGNALRETIKYKQALQEIKTIVCGNYEIIDPQGRKDILKLITKAESEG